MPPPKNGSLGRGLGDLLGGVPENLGVAGASRPSLVPSAPPKEPVPAAPPVPVVVDRRCWTPARVALACVAGIGLIMVGAGLGVWIGMGERTVVWKPGRIVLVTNTVVKTVMVEAASVVEPVAPDVSELQALADQGLKVVVENHGTARVIFDPPVFSSRVSLDPECTGLLDQIGEVLARHSNEWDVQVTGHTDTIPPRHGGSYRDNNELGLARATEVIRHLLRQSQVPASMVHAVTAGEDQPPFPGDDAESRRKNRTVTLQIRVRSK